MTKWRRRNGIRSRIGTEFYTTTARCFSRRERTYACKRIQLSAKKNCLVLIGVRHDVDSTEASSWRRCDGMLCLVARRTVNAIVYDYCTVLYRTEVAASRQLRTADGKTTIIRRRHRNIGYPAHQPSGCDRRPTCTSILKYHTLVSLVRLQIKKPFHNSFFN
jgi:hypothetical protein